MAVFKDPHKNLLNSDLLKPVNQKVKVEETKKKKKPFTPKVTKSVM